MGYLPPLFLDCVVSIGEVMADLEGVEPGPDVKPRWFATGFVYGYFIRPSEDGTHPIESPFLVTARHVVEGAEDAMVIRCNPRDDATARDVLLPMRGRDGDPYWTFHPDEGVDIAVRPLNMPELKQKGMRVEQFSETAHAAELGSLAGLIWEGDGVFVLGFPPELVSGRFNAVVVRGGSIARVQDALRKERSDFLLDVFIFPGNSGGPVVIKPEVGAVEGTLAFRQSLLIGLVCSYVPYREFAISEQTREPRVMFVENSGLALAQPVESINQTIEAFFKRIGKASELEEREQHLAAAVTAEQAPRWLAAHRRRARESGSGLDI